MACKQPWDAEGHSHVGRTCEEAAAFYQADGSSEALLKATTKPCPNCSMRVSHFHGHACHHIKPEGGCPNCGTNWCFQCRATGAENERERGSRSRCRCERGYWSTFCRVSRDLSSHVDAMPYPHDRRCGCVMCPECRPGAPCEQCDGECGVCQGFVSPGPMEMPKK